MLGKDDSAMASHSKYDEDLVNYNCEECVKQPSGGAEILAECGLSLSTFIGKH
jgi:hypothetical protein